MAFLAICVLLDSRLPPMPSSLITYLAQRASKVIPGNSHSGPHTTEEVSRTQFPPIHVFIDSVVRRSGASVPTLLTSLVYLWRLQQRLPTDGKCLPSTPHRIFLAALIVATKSLHDASPWNRHWCQYTVVSSYGYFGFTVPEVNLMEREFLYLLDWDMQSLRPRDLEPRLKTEYQHLVTKLQCESRDGRVERQAQSQDRTTSGCNTIRSTTSTVQRRRGRWRPYKQVLNDVTEWLRATRCAADAVEDALGMLLVYTRRSIARCRTARAECRNGRCAGRIESGESSYDETSPMTWVGHGG
jgi:hypothetical protein